MQIREQGRKIQLIRTRYLPDKKRTESKVFASYDCHLSTIPDLVRQELSNEETEQLEAYLAEREKKKIIDGAKAELAMLHYFLGTAAKALTLKEVLVDFDQQKAEQIYAAMSELKEGLKKAGFPQNKAVNDRE